MRFAPVLALLAAAPPALADDWPAFRHDNARSGVTPEGLSFPLVEQWVHRPLYAPEPGWDDPTPKPVGGWWKLIERPRVRFDDAFHVVSAGGLAFFGSSAEGTVTALEAASGRVRWTFAAGGAVRAAPALWNGRVLFGSDDGWVYALSASDGALLWKIRAAPGDRKVLGFGRMISLWPVRTGVLVDDGTAYFGAGIFPSEGVRLGAVRVEDGRELWRSEPDTSDPKSALSPQGYLLASETRLFVPMGRVPPAAFDRRDGRLLYTTYFDHLIGGTQALLAGGELFTGTEEFLGFPEASPKTRTAWFPARCLVVAGDLACYADGQEVVALSRAAWGSPSVRRRALRIRKFGLEEKIAEARRNLRRLEASVKEAPAKIAALGRKLEEFPSSRKEEAALVEAERDSHRRRWEADTREIQGLQKNLQGQEKELARVLEQLRAAEAETEKAIRWRVPFEEAESMVLAGDALLVGGRGRVAAYRLATGERLWMGMVEGKARGLAVAGGRLFVSTDRGPIHAFGPMPAPLLRPASPAAPLPVPSPEGIYAEAAEKILRETGVRKGFCLVYGAGDGRLALELARRTDLTVVGVEPDAARVEAARRRLLEAGLWGKRVVIEQAPLDRVPFPDYFAHLAVSERALLEGGLPGDPAELIRMLRPLGGTALIGHSSRSLREEEARRWIAAGGRLGADGWLRLERGPLEGAGSWTHQYAEPGNTSCGDDRLVRAPLGVLWFGGPGPGRMVERHAGAAGPLCFGGRLFVQGEDLLVAVDAYTGLSLWEREIPGIPRKGLSADCSNLASDGTDLFLAAGDKCLRIEAATGRTLAEYSVPTAPDGAPRRWGYVALSGGLLFGSRTRAGREADAVFAVDLRTGSPVWVHEGKKIHQITIAVAEGRVFFADAETTSEERREALRDRAAELERLGGEERERVREGLREAEVWRLTALEAATGARVWERPVDLGGCRRVGKGGGNLFAMAARGVLVLCAACTDGHYWEQFFRGDFSKRRVVVLSAADGRLLWSKPIGYRIRPLIVGDRLIAEPWAFDLRTGEPVTRVHPVTGEKAPWQFSRPGHHCGPVNACPQTLFFRSYSVGYHDLEGDGGTLHFTGQRPGCWMNVIPAGGLVLVPEASSGCMCAFPNMCTVALQPGRPGDGWRLYSAAGPALPVKDLAINLGAPGDRKAPTGTLWLGYPRPSGALVFPLNLETRILPGGGYYRDGTAAAGTEVPWVFSSGCRGLTRCAIRLLGEGDPPALYTVRLGFAEPDHESAGRRVFDVRLQGRTVLEGFDPVRAAGGKGAAVVREFRDVPVQETLVVELVPKGGTPAGPEAMPLLNAVEVSRTRTLRLGIRPPEFLTGDLRPEQTRSLVVINHSDRIWTGRLEGRGGGGVSAAPPSRPLRLGPGEKTEVPLTVVVRTGTPEGEYEVGLRLVGSGETAEAEAQARVRHLGTRREVVFPAVADAMVKKQSPQRNFGADPQLWVDGGDQELGDAAESLVYFRFPLEVPGRPLEAVLRLRAARGADAGSGDGGVIRRVEASWEEDRLTYENRPVAGEEVGRVGRVRAGEVVERPLKVRLEGLRELSLVVVPVDLDGCAFASRETGEGAELVVRFGP